MDRGVMNPGTARRRITVDEYYRMAEEGLLAPDARVELIEGEIIDMPPIGTQHAFYTSYINTVLIRTLDGIAHVRAQNPLRLSSDTELQPDVVVAAEAPGEYIGHHPSTADVLLIIEVSDSTLRDDLRARVPLFARHGIPEVWVFDVQKQHLGIHRKPREKAYDEVFFVSEPTALAIELLPNVHIELPKLFKRT